MIRNIFFYISTAVVIAVLSCSNADDLSQMQESYFMPDIDVYVIRASEGGVQGAERFTAPAGYTMHDYIIELFDGRNPINVNGYLSTMGVAFNHARIRIVYVRVNPTDVDLGLLAWRASFTLTDDAGSANKGTFFQESGPLKVYLAGDTTPGAPYAGLGYVNGKGCLVLSQGGRSVSSMSFIIAHELGHNFRLPHPFDGGGLPNPASCSPANQGSTNHIMDYTSRPEIFAPCERIVAATFSIDNGFPKMAWKPDDNLYNVIPYEGAWAGTITVNPSIISMPPITASIEVD